MWERSPHALSPVMGAAYCEMGRLDGIINLTVDARMTNLGDIQSIGAGL